MTRTRQQLLQDWRRERERRVEQRLAGQVICSECGCTLGSFDRRCSAPLDRRCPGFATVEAAYAAVAAEHPRP